jgi:hypothetical protein
MSERLGSNPTFVEIIVGLVLEPRATTSELFERDEPPLAFGIVVLFMLALFAPVAPQALRYGIDVYKVDAVLSVTAVFLGTFLLFLPLEALLLRIHGLYLDFREVLTVSTYSLAPLALALLLLHLFNYFADGSLTFMHLLLTGVGSTESSFLKIVPIALGIALLQIMVVFFHSIQAITKSGSIVVGCITLISFLPLAAAIGGAVAASEFIRPGTLQIIAIALRWPALATYFN